MEPEEIIQFHKRMLIILVNAYRAEGKYNVEQINEVNGKSKLEDSLWKIPEAYGKANTRFISEGVYNIRQELTRLGIETNPRSIWTSTQIQNALLNNQNRLPETNPEYYKFQLEHVVEKQMLIPLIMSAKDDFAINEIIDNYNIGCLVLKSEHNNLPSRIFDENNVWIRYHQAGIRVYDRIKNEWVF